MVTQDTSLLHRSIRDNIRYGRPDADEAQIVEASRRAHADEFIRTLTDAKGPVRIEQSGDAIRIRYTARDGLDFDQTLTPTGPRTVANRMRASAAASHWNTRL